MLTRELKTDGKLSAEHQGIADHIWVTASLWFSLSVQRKLMQRLVVR